MHTLSPEIQGIQISNLEKSYGDLLVLNKINLSVTSGTVLALLGPNGAGKTTTVRILTTLLHPDGGTAVIGGYDVVRHPEKVQMIIGLAGQNAAVDTYLTGYENLRMLGRLYHLDAATARRRATELIEQFDLQTAANRALKTYSGGMRRRIDLAASLIVKPPYLFLDEPTTGLDPVSRNATWEIIRDLVSDGTTVLLTTQYLDEADQLADRIAVIDNGNVIADGTPEELKRTIGGQEFTATFRTAADLSQAQDLLTSMHVATTIDNLSIHVATPPGDDGLAELAGIMRKLGTDGPSIEDYTISRPTLDDVFLRLTGHHTEEALPTPAETIHA